MDGVGTEHAGINVYEVDVWDYETCDMYVYEYAIVCIWFSSIETYDRRMDV